MSRMKFDISSMLNPEVYDHPVGNIELIETHISWVLLTGDFAYKIKKPVNFGFLDFSTLEKRHRYCEAELILNRRMAPDIYLGVVSISDKHGKPVFSDDGEVVEYAIKMVQFPQSSQLDEMLRADMLGNDHIDAIAVMTAVFHQSIPVADESMDYGEKDVVYLPVEENFIQIYEHIDTRQYADSLDAIAVWSHSTFEALEAVFLQRKRDGFIRECHGDMHLRNLLWLNDKPLAFDCIEFNAHFRWIDVISEVAFLMMDLQEREQDRLANRFLNTYLETTGDYAGLSVLPFYLCYRAMVRAKVDALRLAQEKVSEEERAKSSIQFQSYLDLAKSYTQKPEPKLIIMHGMSGSGKSTVAQQLVDTIDVIRIRSDVERKRMFDSVLIEAGEDKIDSGLYSMQATEQTYARLLELTALVIAAGYSVIVDAAFLKHEQRDPFRTLAESLNVPFMILSAGADEQILRRRIAERKNDASDADIVVLDHQLSNWRSLHEDEANVTISVDTGDVLNIEALLSAINSK